MEMSEVITSPIFLDNNESNQLPINIEVSSSSYSTFNITPSLRLGPVFASYLKEGRWQLCWSDWSTGIIAFYPSNSLITFSEPNQSKLKPHPELLKKRIGNEQLLQIPTGNNNKQKRSRGKISYLPKSQCFFMKRVNLTIMSFNSSQFSSSNNNNLGEANKTQDNSSNEVCSELLLNIINNESNSIEIENKVKIENEICEKKELENDPSSFSSLSYHNNIKEEFGIVIKCQNSDNYDIYFRCILRKDQVLDLKKFIEDCAESIKIEELSLDPVQACEEISVSANKSFISPSHSTSNSFMNSVSESTSSFIFFSSTSLFNATIGPFMSSMSSNERVSSKRKILSRDVESKSKRKTSLDCLHPDDCQNDTNSPILNSTQILKSNFSKVSKLSSKVSPLKKIKKKKKYWNFSFFNYGNNKIKSIDNQEADKLINEVLSAVQDNLTAANTLESVHPTVESLPTSNTPKSSFNLSQGKSKLNSLASPVSNYSYSLSSPSYSNICQSPGLSSMRRAISRAMDRHERDTRGNILKTRRGTFKWLPLYSYGHSDLVIGSWFFVIGSIGAIFTSLIVILNRYYGFLGVFDDGAGLTKMEFVSSWVLLAISSFFSTVGSLAFVRAFHCDPPMRPLFQQKYLNRINEINQMNLKWEYDYLIKNYYEMTKFNEKNESIDYSMIENLKNSLDITIPDPPKRRNLYYHIQSDELLASWLFLLATIPFIPYSLIYLFGDPHSEYVSQVPLFYIFQFSNKIFFLD